MYRLHPVSTQLLAPIVVVGAYATPVTAADEGNLELPPVEVTAGAPAPGAPLYQSAAIDVVTGEEKDRRESASLGATLEHLPGVTNISAGTQVGKPVIRGLSGNRISILSNGIAVDHQQFGTRHQPNIDPFLSERIEVVRGASSILYGSGALGGAVDVQSQPLTFSPDGSSSAGGEALLGFRTNNDQWDTGVKGTARGGRWSLSGGLVSRDGDEIETPNEPTSAESGDPSDPKFTGELPFTDFEQVSGQLGVGYRADFGEIRLRYTGWRNEQNFLLPNGKGIGLNLENDEVQLSGLFPTGKTWTLEPSLTWQNNLREANAAGVPRSELFDGTTDIEFDQYTARLDARHGALGPFDAGTIGVEYRDKEQESRGTTQLTPGGEVENIGVFAFEERTFGDLTVQAGLRHDWQETVALASETRADTIFGARDENDYSVTTGSLGAVYGLTENLALAGNLGRGFRAPTLFELYADGVHGGVAAVQEGNADLDAERSLNTDIGLRWESPRLSASATVYRNEIDDFIFLESTGNSAPSGLPIFRHTQDDATLTGIELQVRGMVTDSLELAATFDAVDGENDATDEDLPLQPADELRLEGTWFPTVQTPVRDLYVRLGVRYNASKDAAPREPFVQFDSLPFGTASTDSYTVADLGIGFAFGGTAERPMRLDIKIRNLTDEDYRDFLDTYKGYALSSGRDIQLELRVPFGT